MRCICVILDGLGDRGHAAFRGRTPLQVAHTPYLDKLAALGMNGLYHSFFQGIAMSSEMAHFRMFGYDVHDFPGRGLLEAVGEGIPVKNGEVALLARLVSVDEEERTLVLRQENPEVDAHTCHVLQEEIERYEKDGVEVHFVPTKGIKGILVMRGHVSSQITDSNPIYEGRPLMEVLPLHGQRKDTGAHLTARILNEYLIWCYRTLSEHPLNAERVKEGVPALNAVGTQRAGQMRHLPSFEEKWGLRALSIASGPVYVGLGTLLGMNCHGATDSEEPGKDLLDRLRAAKEMEDFDFVHVHTKAVDEASHAKDPDVKRTVIESLDPAFAFALDEIVPDKEVLLVITSDHSTPSTGKMIHSGETVPLTILGKYTRRDGVTGFDEIRCAGGSLGVVRGNELMYLILNFLDRGKLFGLMDSPIDRPYMAADSKPLKVK